MSDCDHLLAAAAVVRVLWLDLQVVDLGIGAAAGRGSLILPQHSLLRLCRRRFAGITAAGLRARLWNWL